MKSLQERDPTLEKRLEFVKQSQELGFSEVWIAVSKMVTKTWGWRDVSGAVDLASKMQKFSDESGAQHSFSRTHGQEQDDQSNSTAFLLANSLPGCSKFCQSCASRQLTRGRKVTRAPLIPLPIMTEPFSRIAMDIVGPLSRSRRGNRYVHTSCIRLIIRKL